jgi:TolB protein
VTPPIRWWLAALLSGCASAPPDGIPIYRDATLFAPGIASTAFSEARLTISPDGRTALWFSRNRPGGAGGYDIWRSRRGADGQWMAAEPVSFNSGTRDFDPAFSADGRHVYFSSDRAGGLGGDDLWRVRVTGDSFGEPEPLGAAVNSARNEWAPMLSPDNRTLLFSSDGRGGAGSMDLFTAILGDTTFAAAAAVPGDINTPEDEFDATYLADGQHIVFSRSRDLSAHEVHLFHSAPAGGRYPRGVLLPESVNTAGSNTYAPMLDWSRADVLTFTTRRPANNPHVADLYVVKYRPR